MPWKKAYPTEKVRALVGALTLGFNVIVPQKDLNDQIQASKSYEDLGRRLAQLYDLAADLEDVIALCRKNLT